MLYVVRPDRVVQSFHTGVEDVSCVLDYTLTAGVITITHTGVPTQTGGHGIASALVQAALDAAESERSNIVPGCSYAAASMQRDHACAELLA